MLRGPLAHSFGNSVPGSLSPELFAVLVGPRGSRAQAPTASCGTELSRVPGVLGRPVCVGLGVWAVPLGSPASGSNHVFPVGLGPAPSLSALLCRTPHGADGTGDAAPCPLVTSVLAVGTP